MRKNFIAGAAVLALLMNSPQVSAQDDIVIFGGEFEEETTPLPSKKIEKPEPTKDLPKPPAPKPEPAPPIEEPLPVQPAEQPQPPPPQTELNQPFERQTEISGDRERLPVKIEQREPPAPASEHTVIGRRPKNTETTPPNEEPADEPIVIEPQPIEPQPIEPTPIEPTPIEPQPIEPQPIEPQPIEPQPIEQPPRQTQPPRALKTLKQRFIKLAVDDTYTYYLDKTSVQWRKMPYSTSEYIADVWVRMIEREAQTLDADMASYGADNFNAEISLAREQGYQYSPEDLKVLQSQAYVLEHYYLRPKTNQIQFLCELEVFGRPQNTVNERAYDYRHWENLVPGSVESIIYAATIKIIGKGKADPRGHMTFTDMLDEYLRIAL